MNSVLLGAISGMAFSLLTVLVMLPIKWADSRKKFEAIVGAAIERLIVGFVICNLSLVTPIWLNAILIGVTMSLPSAIITRNYVPILAVGTLGSLMIGLVQLWVSP